MEDFIILLVPFVERWFTIMKDKIIWLIGIIALVIGVPVFMDAQDKISNNPFFTWSRPYTSYEEQVMQSRWFGIMLIVLGVVCIGSEVYRKIYTNKHVKNVDQLMQKGGYVKCADCGLAISADVKVCPRCGRAIGDEKASNNGKNSARFCKKCGNQMNADDLFCRECGNKNI